MSHVGVSLVSYFVCIFTWEWLFRTSLDNYELGTGNSPQTPSMKPSTLFNALCLTAIGMASALTPRAADNSTCTQPRPAPDLKGTDIRRIGMVLFPAFDMIDVFGTLDPLQLLALTSQRLSLHLVARTLEPVSTLPLSMNAFNSSFFPAVAPTDTFDDDVDLDALIVPGGPGARNPDLAAELAYIRRTFPRVKLLVTVCTGAGVAARAGVLDGFMATTNKRAWATITAMGPAVEWVAPARFVVDGKVWSSSGVTSALDLVFALVERYWGRETAERIAGTVEHTTLGWREDVFSEYWGVERTEVQPCDV